MAASQITSWIPPIIMMALVKSSLRIVAERGGVWTGPVQVMLVTIVRVSTRMGGPATRSSTAHVVPLLAASGVFASSPGVGSTIAALVKSSLRIVAKRGEVCPRPVQARLAMMLAIFHRSLIALPLRDSGLRSPRLI
jgi:hypothetical protein